MTTWKELKAQGVRRCCVMFKDGTQCRRRAVEAFEWSWCAKHGPTMERILDADRKMLEACNYGNKSEESDDEC